MDICVLYENETVMIDIKMKCEWERKKNLKVNFVYPVLTNSAVGQFYQYQANKAEEMFCITTISKIFQFWLQSEAFVFVFFETLIVGEKYQNDRYK